ncbi:PIN domain-containing protein [Pseudacidovorax intermedius]|uniref:Twitching motility protein PilT n=1 Tax=Pseudacidovorax intermedius TaxID=433924 RepID=A0A147GN75_9BURK|nr:type II toxin-antitoxin system VapC family toxin [Pseudacidovorax intermedius]KTT15048.1 twitching motility protein PilT [Pseudacidovorax intermedius]
MAGLDTNVLVRWLVDDDAEQTERVGRCIETARHRKEALFVPLTVILELEWVLRSRYGFAKPSILSTFTALLETRELSLESEHVVERALHGYREGRADFADCLHAAACHAADQAPLLTLDAKAARLPDAQLLLD